VVLPELGLPVRATYTGAVNREGGPVFSRSGISPSVAGVELIIL
jgi:hypothetical protein